MSILKEVPVPNFHFDVNSVSKRALTKLVHQRTSISGHSGANGNPGSDGSDGTSGMPGQDGSNGRNGGRGGAGNNGSAGQSGQSGTDSRHALIRLNGTVENLNMQIKTYEILYGSSEQSFSINWNLAHFHNDANYDFQLAKTKGIILVRAVGGHGGDGGVGGNGGNGGNGGSGGRGCDGKDGPKCYNQGALGKRGGPGGSGGNGGCGGNGGNGGSGGDGGNAGAGGHVQVRTADPRLLMLIELDCRAGMKGKGGNGGKGGCYGVGGQGGDGGNGGSGSRAWPGTSASLCGADGEDGAVGRHGSYGFAGNDGPNGNDGRAASDGSIQYTVVDIDGNVIETGTDKYHATVFGYTITDENDDEIYEPNSDFFITNVKWTNNGAMKLPSGSILSFSSTKYISNDIKDVSVLTGANINQILIDSHQFRCHLNDVSTVSINQPYILPVTIASEINLLDRLFTASQVSTTLTCQYPIQITNIQIPTFLGPNEPATIIVNFTNISTRSYGTCPDSAGSIEFLFYTHSLIKILSATAEYSYRITPDGQGRYKINEKLSPKSTKSIYFAFSLDADASYQLYESLFWNIDLLLRDTLIEKRTDNIRVVPKFNPNVKTDVLLVTNSQTNRIEYLAYQKLFQLFKYSSQMWDIERYGVFHHPEIQWLNAASLVIFIYSNPKSTFNVIKSQFFLHHMNSSENAGFICIGTCLPNDFDFALFDYNNLQFIDKRQKTKCEGSNHLWSGFGCIQSNTKKLNMMANELRTDYEKQQDHKFLYQVVYDDTDDACSQHCMTVVYGKKYVYKSTLNSEVGNRLIVINSKSPLLADSHLPFKLQAQLKINQQSEVIPSCENKIRINKMHGASQFEDIIQLNSQFGRLLCATLFYQGFKKSLMMISEKSILARCIFVSDSNKFTFNEILVSLAMSIIEREYNRGSLEFHTSKRIVNQAANVIGKVNNITRIRCREEGRNDWLYLLIQSLYEYIDSKFCISFPWYGCRNKAKQRQKLQEILDDLLSLSAHEIPKNEALYHAVQMMRLQKLAKLQFPAADARENCARQITEIRAWKEEQRIKEAQSPTGKVPSSAQLKTIEKFNNISSFRGQLTNEHTYDMSTYKLFYLNGRCRAEVSRLTFTVANQKFEDIRVERDQWPSRKNEMPLGQIPVLEFNGMKLSQSLSIARFLAKQFELAGRDTFEQAKVDAVVDTINDLVTRYVAVRWASDETKREELIKTFFADELPKHLQNLEALGKLYGNAGVYFVGNHLTWTDFACS
ncbi:unnamed protein product [Rotaria sp. Silwood2]|nr:unnamed protein product [Rotaria sp. Silwood2]CAF4009216.1 unnamed protein product [Rotaria sp. Silwood2]